MITYLWSDKPSFLIRLKTGCFSQFTSWQFEDRLFPLDSDSVWIYVMQLLPTVAHNHTCINSQYVHWTLWNCLIMTNVSVQGSVDAYNNNNNNNKNEKNCRCTVIYRFVNILSLTHTSIIFRLISGFAAGAVTAAFRLECSWVHLFHTAVYEINTHTHTYTYATQLKCSQTHIHILTCVLVLGNY